MNSTQQCLISALNSAEYFKNNEKEKIFHSFAMEIFQDKTLEKNVNQLIEQKYITNEGLLTTKGRLSIVHNPKQLSDLQLSMNTRSHIVESLERDSLKTKVVGQFSKKGTLSFLDNKQFSNLLDDVLDELFDRTNNSSNFTLSETAQVYLENLKIAIAVETIQEESVITHEEVVDMVTEQVIPVESIKPKKTSSKKAKVA